jgi:hypothetical protein
MKKKKNCDNCSALTKEYSCGLGYVMHVNILEFLNKEISMPAPDEPCPKPKTETEYMYWKTKGKIE